MFVDTGGRPPPTLDTEPDRAGGLRPRAAARAVPGRRPRHHRRQLRRGRDRVDRARHQRGQRPPGHRRCPGSTSPSWAWSAWSPTGTRSTCCSTLLARSATGQHLLDLHERRHRARAAAARPTGPTSCTSSSSTTAAATCWAASSTRCSTASAAAPASTCAPSTARSAATPTAGCTRGRWARCSRRCWPATSPRPPRWPTPRRCAAPAWTPAR